jgi:type IV secretory pathway TraG/TraD family ATPase VirD4
MAKVNIAGNSYVITSDVSMADLEHLFMNNDGFFIGGKWVMGNLGEPVLTPLVIPPGKNICITGNSGTGKSTCFINRSLDTWGGTMLVVDINGTSADFYAALRKPRPFKVLNMMEGKDIIFRYDPFHLIRRTPEKARKIIRKLVSEIIPIPANEDVKSKYFLNSARNILTGALVYHYYLSPESCFMDALIAINDTPFEILLTKIDEKVRLRYMSQITGIKNRDDKS